MAGGCEHPALSSPPTTEYLSQCPLQEPVAWGLIGNAVFRALFFSAVTTSSMLSAMARLSRLAWGGNSTTGLLPGSVFQLLISLSGHSLPNLTLMLGRGELC